MKNIIFWKNRITNNIEMMNSLLKDENLLIIIQNITRKMIDLREKGNKILICGNGGSAADAQHIASELMNGIFFKQPICDIEALSVNTSCLTAIGNDCGFDLIFSKQIEVKGKKGDILIGLSTSGKSVNVIKAFKAAKKLGMLTIGLTGADKKSPINKLVDYCINVPSLSVPRIQEAHILIGHMICEFIEQELFFDKKNARYQSNK